MIRALILALLFAAPGAYAACPAGWTDAGGGDCSHTVTVTMPDTEAAMVEQLRADHNYSYRYAGDAMDTPTWLAAMLTGFTATQKNNVELFDWCKTLWGEFKRKWLSRATMSASSDGGDTEGLAVSVPAPPAGP